ncbi:unnamed protein product [Blepharisma stoltei]|uniref:RING-type domain-containing protein n=1 Tax=Blepharisma stoltei TaxID=1481888 RepID=A0AAU9K6R3_9CILI|nr:unnamed protein product [Blepharisma stoltei]
MERYLNPQHRNTSSDRKPKFLPKPPQTEETKKHCEQHANQMHIGVLKSFNDSDKLKKLTTELQEHREKELKYLKIINELKHIVSRQNEQLTKLTKENDKYRRKLESSRREELELQMAMRLSAMEGIDPEVAQSALMSGENLFGLGMQQAMWSYQDPTDPDNMTYEQLLELGEQIGTVNVGLSNEEIEGIKVVENANGCCSICQNDFIREDVKELRCGHQYHIECISKWLIKKKKCPMCFENAIEE